MLVQQDSSVYINAASMPSKRIDGPICGIIVLVCIFISCSCAEDFSHTYVIFNAWLMGSGIALIAISSIVRVILKPRTIRRAVEKDRQERAREFRGVIIRQDKFVGTTTARIVGLGLTIRCTSGELVKIFLPTEVAGLQFDVGHEVLKRKGERWPVDMSASRPLGSARQPPRHDKPKCYRLPNGNVVHVQPDCGLRGCQKTYSSRSSQTADSQVPQAGRLQDRRSAGEGLRWFEWLVVLMLVMRCKRRVPDACR
jgi:hypothetical protein